MPHRSALVVALLLAVAYEPARASTLQWRGIVSGHAAPDGETFDLPDNWIPFSVPGGADRVRFDLAGVSPNPIHTGFPRAVQAVEVAGTSVTLLNVPQIAAAEYEVGEGGAPSTLRIVGGTLSGSTWRIGRLGPGTLELAGGIQVTAFDADVATGAAGTIDLAGAGTSWTQAGQLMTLGVGAHPGRITVREGGRLTTAGMSGEDADVSVQGPGSFWEDTNVVAFDHGPRIAGGAKAELHRMLVLTPNPGRPLYVLDAGSELRMHGTLELGRPGAAVVGGGRLITEGATVVDQFGFVEVDDAGSRWDASGPVLVSDGANLIFDDGAAITSSGSVYMGLEGPGYAILYESTTWNHAGIQLGSGVDGNGLVDVRAGSLLDGAPVSILRGRVRVDGPGARWNVHGNQSVSAGGAGPTTPQQSRIELTGGAEAHVDGTVGLGYHGGILVASGSLLVADQLNLSCPGPDFAFDASDGKVRTNRLILLYSCSAPEFGTLEFGHAAGPTAASFTLQPPQALFARRLVLGREAAATFLHTGDLLTALQFVLGEQASGVGEHDNFSELNVDGLRIGDAGAGTFRHHASNTTVDDDLAIAVTPGSSGLLRMLGGTILVHGSAYVGGSRSGPGGTGLLAQTAGTIAIDDTLFLFPGDSLKVTGGSFSASVIDLMGGLATWKGTIHGKVINRGDARCEPEPGEFVLATLVGDYDQRLEGTLRLRAASIAGHDQLSVSGAATLDGTLALEMDPAFVATAGARVRLVSAGAVSGTFTQVTGLTPPGAYRWALEVGVDHVDLVAQTNGFPSVPAASDVALVLASLAAMALGGCALRRTR